MILHDHLTCMHLAFLFYVLVYLHENILLHIILWGTYCTIFHYCSIIVAGPLSILFCCYQFLWPFLSMKPTLGWWPNNCDGLTSDMAQPLELSMNLREVSQSLEGPSPWWKCLIGFHVSQFILYYDTMLNGCVKYGRYRCEIVIQLGYQRSLN